MSGKLVGGHATVDRQVETASGSIDQVREKFVFNLDIQGHISTLSVFVFNAKFDLILGRNWLKVHKLRVVWEDDSLHFLDRTGNLLVIHLLLLLVNLLHQQVKII